MAHPQVQGHPQTHDSYCDSYLSLGQSGRGMHLSLGQFYDDFDDDATTVAIAHGTNAILLLHAMVPYVCQPAWGHALT